MKCAEMQVGDIKWPMQILSLQCCKLFSDNRRLGITVVALLHDTVHLLDDVTESLYDTLLIS